MDSRCTVCSAFIYDEFAIYPASVQGGFIYACLDCDLFADTIALDSEFCLDEWRELV